MLLSYASTFMLKKIKINKIFLFKKEKKGVRFFAGFARHRFRAERRGADALRRHARHLRLNPLTIFELPLANKLIASIVMLANSGANLLMNVYLLQHSPTC